MIIYKIPQLKKYFEVGNIVPSYIGRDVVIKFNEPIKNAPYPANYWSVDVAEINDNGDVIGHIRNHSTCPTVDNYNKIVK